MKSETVEDLYEMIEDIGTAMLVTENHGHLRSRPMRGKIYKDSGEIWFLTEAASGKSEEISQDHSSNLAYSCPKDESYVSVTGRAYLTRDKEKIDDLWGPWAKAWLQCDKDDAKVAAIRFQPIVAEYWEGESSTLKQTWELAKANITDEKPDMGENKTVVL